MKKKLKKEIKWYDVLFNADARNNYKLIRGFASSITIEDLIKYQNKK